MNADTIIASNVRAHTVSGYTSHSEVVKAHERSIRFLVSQVNDLTFALARAEPIPVGEATEITMAEWVRALELSRDAFQRIFAECDCSTVAADDATLDLVSELIERAKGGV